MSQSMEAGLPASGGGGDAEEFFAEVESEVVLPPPLTGEEAVVAVLCVLQRRLTGGEARPLVQALPRPVRARVQSCPRHHVERAETFDGEGYRALLADHLRVSEDEAEDLARAVFAVMGRWLPLAVVQHMDSQVPLDLRGLWRAAFGATAEQLPELRIASAVLDEVRRNAPLPPETDEGEAVAAVLCTLFQRLDPGDADDLARELSPALGSLVEPCARHRGEPGEVFGREQFIGRVAQHLGVPADQAEQIALAVFTAIDRLLSPGGMQDLASQLPRDLQALWKDAAATSGVPAV
jgi:uncharacterized protein (DUF2267 family)